MNEENEERVDDLLLQATEALGKLVKADPWLLNKRQGAVARIHHRALRVFNDAYAPNLATRFDDNG